MWGAEVTARSGGPQGEQIYNREVWSEGSVIRGNSQMVQDIQDGMLAWMRALGVEVPVTINIDGDETRSITIGPETTSEDLLAFYGDLGTNVVGMINAAIQRQMDGYSQPDPAEPPARTPPLYVDVDL